MLRVRHLSPSPPPGGAAVWTPVYWREARARDHRHGAGEGWGRAMTSSAPPELAPAPGRRGHALGPCPGLAGVARVSYVV